VGWGRQAGNGKVWPWCQWHRTARDLGKEGRCLPAIEKVGPRARDVWDRGGVDFLNGENRVSKPSAFS
jgi:hypothetical protein